MIEIGDTHTLNHDGLQWILTHHPKGREYGTKDGKKTGIIGKKTFYGRIERAFDRILDDYIADSASLEGMARSVSEARQAIGAAALAVAAAIYGQGGSE